ncbi:hypothetical protein ABT075_46670 [Streptomyces sp. NPDC002677]|uniref:hypothetical protein n=1 Tax=Streptomyces sp. NPDC002677 TaxID=3154774 RepID=UPI0033299233
MGTVWRARDQLLDRPVAAKELHILPHGDEEHRVRRRSVADIVTACDSPLTPTPVCGGPSQSPLLDRIRQRHREVNELAATGMSLSAIGRCLRLDRKTVRRYRNKDLEDLFASAQDRGHGVLDPYIDHVQHRFKAGCTSSMQIFIPLCVRFRGDRLWSCRQVGGQGKRS